ncbi:hypothetical protein ALC60_02202, partial [Trachymyrmex zeteki]
TTKHVIASMQYCQFLGHQQLSSQLEQIPNHEPYAQDFLADRLHENNVMRKRLRPLLTRIALSCSVTRLGCFFLAKKIPILHAISQSANRESNLRFTHLSRYVALTIVDRSIAQYSVNPRGVPDCQEAAILVVR